ncbi:MAG: sigma-70 family RNA polymerase sigma factor, partial [Bacteroidaceae bacterium]|nr:sigma-70 family RNA polymerase sigma factor [Bacteroidaceae bacterium]
METEQQLLDTIHSGNRAALRRLYDRYSGYAMAVVLRYIPEREEVRDVLQDSFVKILTSVGKFDYRGEGSLKSWISRIVSNCAIEHIREHERIAFVSDIPDSVDEEAPDIRDIPPDLLTELIGRLPANYRLVLNLFVYEQCSH